MTTDPSDIVERLSDLARFYLNERPTVNPQERSPTLVELGEPEAQEIASELYKAINEILSLRAALANAKAEERERCARVAEQKVTRVSFEKPGGEVEVYKWKDGPEIAAAIRALT